jgi:hypothetical protein
MAAFEAAAATATGSGNPEIAKILRRLKKKSKPVPFRFPEASPPTPSSASSGLKNRKRGPVGDASWLATIRALGENVADRVSAANAVGGWLAAHLERALQTKPGDSEWFFEIPEVVQFLDAGAFQALLDAMTHSVVSIVEKEREKREDANAGEAAAEAANMADLAKTLTGVLHNMLHPSLRAWSTRKQHQALLAALEQVLRMEGSPLNDAKGVAVSISVATKQFTALCAKILNNQGALAVLTGHDTLARARLQLLRALTQRARGKNSDATKEDDLTNRINESARALVVLQRCRRAGDEGSADASFSENSGLSSANAGTVKPAWEAVLDGLLTDAGADAIRDEVRATIEQHALLAGAFPKFGFEGSVGI